MVIPIHKFPRREMIAMVSSNPFVATLDEVKAMEKVDNERNLYADRYQSKSLSNYRLNLNLQICSGIGQLIAFMRISMFNKERWHPLFIFYVIGRLLSKAFNEIEYILFVNFNHFGCVNHF